MAIGYLGGLLMGIVLGLLGSGGSLLSLPIFVYFFKIDPQVATAYSLLVVGVVAGIGFVQGFKKQAVDFKQSLVFAIPSVAGIFGVRHYLLPAIPEVISFNGLKVSKNFLILILFSFVMMAAARSMIWSKTEAIQKHSASLGKIWGYGLFVGALAGTVGAGGGFLIVPALVNLLHFKMKDAVVVSMGIVMLNSFVGVFSDFLLLKDIDMGFILAFLLISLLGLFLGRGLQNKISENKLKPIFGYFVLILGLVILSRELFIGSNSR